ncbi:MAG: AAA-like domain-containing protein [Hydrococcus sp. C42_A2020_068]|nr:AAA-like domain-containing protein [Hydrococcus sp. C42_A2020_068]
MMRVMAQGKQGRRRRKRGVILTSLGLKKLQKAKTEAEYKENCGHRYTLEALSERTGLAVDTLMKVFASEAGVDKQTLKACFSAFNLILEANDYYRPEPQNELVEPTALEREPELPEGQVPLDSAFYIERAPIEFNCYKAILQPGALIRIKAPRQMGKTSLMSRILDYASKERCQTVPINFQLADKGLFQDLDRFLQWFCANVSLGAQLPNCLSQFWDELFGSKISCKLYFEQYLLAKLNRPLVLGLDNIDWLFQYPELADDFFGLLRAWHEEAKNREIWKKLRLVVVHSTEVYIPLNVNQSPFNVGLPIELPEFTPEEVLDLAKRYGLNWSTQEVEQLMALVGGQPYLVRLALYYLGRKEVALEQILSSPTSIYSDRLQRQLWNLQSKQSGLAEAFARVVMAGEPVELDLIDAFKLQSLGLVRLQGGRATPSCKLYAQYFRAYFNSSYH